jgi:hypothetical protein
MKDESKSKEKHQEFNWYFIDEEDDFETLLESLNAKGVHEKKLIENLKKIRFQLKLKKVKKVNTPTLIDGKPQNTEENK